MQVMTQEEFEKLSPKQKALLFKMMDFHIAMCVGSEILRKNKTPLAKPVDFDIAKEVH